MKEYRCDSKSLNWYEKINFFKGFCCIFVSYLVSFLFFYFLGKNIDNALGVSFIVSFLIFIGFVISSLIDNRTAIYMINDDSIKYIELHSDYSGRYLTDYQYKDIVNMVKPLKIFENIENYQGIDSGEILEINRVHEYNNRIVIYAKVKEKYWKNKGLFFYGNVHLEEKEKNKKIIITSDYQNYDDICKMFSKKCSI